MIKPIILIQARINSTRFPRKILAPFGAYATTLEYMYVHVKESKRAMHTYIIAPEQERELELFPPLIPTVYIDVPVNDVMGRYVRFIRDFRLSPIAPIIRLTADCPLIRAEYIDNFIDQSLSLLEASACIVTNRPCDADGFDMELFRVCDLIRLYDNANAHEREHVTPALYANLDVRRVKCVYDYDNDVKYSIDTEAEYNRIKLLAEGEQK